MSQSSTYSSSSSLDILRPQGWRHSATWTYLIMLITSATALLVSFILSAETLELARHPGQKLNCDVNGVVSCSTVAESWQAEFIKFGGLSFPNAFFGIAAESVFVVIAVIGLARITLPRWFAALAWLGNVCALAYAVWLFSQSAFVIHALCPWCLVLLFSTSIQCMAQSHATVTVQNLPSAEGRFAGMRRGLNTYYRLNADLLIDVLWIAVLVGIIVLKYGSAIF